MKQAAIVALIVCGSLGSVPAVHAQCTIEIRDLTRRVPEYPGQQRPLVYEAIARGGTTSTYVEMRIQGVYIGSSNGCRAPECSTQMFEYCVPPGATVWAFARCDGKLSTDVTTTMPVVAEYPPQPIAITRIERLLSGRHRVHTEFALSAGQNYLVNYYVMPKLADGTYGPPVYQFTSDVTASPDDKVRVTLHTCAGRTTETSSFAEALIPRPDTPTQQPPPLIEFALTGATPERERRVLIHKYRADDRYPSGRQTRDREMPIDLFVRNRDGAPVAGQQVFLRVVDPPDAAAYIPRDQRRPGDNVDPAGGDTAGILTASAVMTDANGAARTILRATDQYAGDNYQVEASLDQAFTCATAGTGGTNACAKSGVITAWKRVYVEVNPMARKGAFLSRRVMPGEREFEVRDINVFPAPPFRVRLLHAPHTLGTSGTFYSEELTVLGKTATEPPVGAQQPGILRLDDPSNPATGDVVQQTYSAADRPRGTERPYLADAVMLVSGNRSADVYGVDRSLVEPLFDEAFTELIWLAEDQRDPSDIAYDGTVPFWPPFEEQNPPIDTQREWFTRKWLRHAQRLGEDRHAHPNHQAVFLGARGERPDTPGATTVRDGFNDAWLFLESGPLRNPRIAREALVHELGHQWWVNAVDFRRPFTLTGGHCDAAFGTARRMYNHRDKNCTMTDGMDIGTLLAEDGIVGFHYEVLPNGRADSEFLRIRQRREPVPQNERSGRVLQ